MDVLGRWVKLMSGALLVAAAHLRAPGVIQTSIGSGSAASNCTLVLKNDGAYTMSGAGGGAWVAPAVAAVAQHYQVKVDMVSGTLSSGTTGTWIDCDSADSNRTWVENSGSCVITLTYREKATGLVRGTQDVAMTV